MTWRGGGGGEGGGRGGGGGGGGGSGEGGEVFGMRTHDDSVDIVVLAQGPCQGQVGQSHVVLAGNISQSVEGFEQEGLVPFLEHTHT